MSIDKAQQLALFAQELSPDLNNSTYIIAQTYVDKGKLNQSLGNLSHALKNYKEALLVDPSIEPLLISEYKSLAKR